MQSARLDLTAKLEPAAMQAVETPPQGSRSTFTCKYSTSSLMLAPPWPFDKDYVRALCIRSNSP